MKTEYLIPEIEIIDGLTNVITTSCPDDDDNESEFELP